jgi:hypothetical protein
MHVFKQYRLRSEPMKTIGLVAFLVACAPANTLAQAPAALFDPASLDALAAQLTNATARSGLTAATYVPITARERIEWIVIGTIGLQSLIVVGPLSAGWQTAFNTPEEWGRSWEGFGKRYLAREADVAISNSLEAGVGAIWGEDPRYIPSGRTGIWPRARYAMKTVFLAQRRDGRLAPAWGRYVGNTLNNIIENSYLPSSITTPGQTALRSANGFLGRLGGNLWDEFWPDARRLLFQRKKT